MTKRSSSFDGYWAWYEKSRPIRVDGIRAKTARGSFAHSWWGKRWLEALTEIMDSGRLSRGRSYARRGQVLNIDLRPGHVTAHVQGSSPRPYKVSIQLQPLTDAQWEAVLDELAAQAIFAAELLNGKMPDEIGDVFDLVSVPLFPASDRDLETDCTCPDWVNPCKHIAAVYHLLAEQFEENPFLLFQLRGRDQTQLLHELRSRRSEDAPEAEVAPNVPYDMEAVSTPSLPDSLESYWGSSHLDEAIQLKIVPPEVDLGLIKRAGVPDFVDKKVFRAKLEEAYAGITVRALQTAYSDED